MLIPLIIEEKREYFFKDKMKTHTSTLADLHRAGGTYTLNLWVHDGTPTLPSFFSPNEMFYLPLWSQVAS